MGEGDFPGVHSDFKWRQEDVLLRMGVYKSGGWAFDFRDELKKYIVRYTDGHLEEMWAPDRTSLRNALGSSRIHYIVDVPVEKYY